MNIIAFGISHQTTPIEIREKFSLSVTQQELYLSELKSHPAVIEAFVISTCNRVEVYAHVLDKDMDILPLLRIIFLIKNVPFDTTLIHYFYRFSGEAAVDHLLRVVTGLDSMVLGEKQILGQVKTAFERARRMGILSRHFNILANVTIRAGKKAQHETAISIGGSSISWAAITKVEEICKTLKDKEILIIGAGKMSDLAAEQLHNKGVKKLYLMNRTMTNAQDLARRYQGEVVPFCDIKEVLRQVDICLCSVGAPHYILDKDTMVRIMSGRRHPLLMMDISMPRNIDPAIAQVDNVRLYAIDDLRQVVDSNMRTRQGAIRDVERIVAAKKKEYVQKLSLALQKANL